MQSAPGILNSSKTSMIRQKPTRLPYSCQAQFGTSVIGAPPAEGVRTVRVMACVGSHSSTATITQTAIRAPSGSLSGERSVIGEYAKRSVGSVSPFGDVCCAAFFGCLLTIQLCLSLLNDTRRMTGCTTPLQRLGETS